MLVATAPAGDTWAVIDARDFGGEVTPVTWIAGLPLVARHVRMAARQGWAGATVLCADEAGRTAVARALARRLPPPGFPVETTVAPLAARASAVSLDAAALYSADALASALAVGSSPPAGARLGTVTDVQVAEAELFRSLKKGIALDGVVAYYFMRPLSRLVTRALLRTPVTPNQVTLVALACGLAAAFAAARGGHFSTLAAGLLFWAGAAIDCVDGELARLRLEGSRLGEWLDTVADDLSTFGLLAGLGLGLWRDGAGPAWAAVGVGGAVLGLATQARLYVDLHRMRLPIDTAQYPWFFGKPSDAGSARGALGRVFYGFSFLFRRDAFVTLTTILLLFQLRAPAVFLLAGGAAVVAGLLVVHWIVMAGRARRARLT